MNGTQAIKCNLDNLSVSELREVYRQLRENASYVIDPAKWDKMVKDLVDAGDYTNDLGIVEKPTGVDYVMCARRVTVKCNACRNGEWKNGKMCFRCEGKGKLDQSDMVRNAYYDNHFRRVR